MDDDWPDGFDEDQAIEAALKDDAEGELAPFDEDDATTLATGIISHQLRCRLRSGAREYINDNSSFRVPHTDEYLVRVALYNASGVRVYLGPFRSKGTANGYRTLPHTEAVWDDRRLTRRALVLWKSVNGGSVWSSWTNCS